MLGGWITVQTLLIGASHFLQAVYFILAVIVFVIGVFYKTAFIKKNA
jgi:type II secretory pathway component PulF